MPSTPIWNRETLRGYPEPQYESKYEIIDGPNRLPIEWHKRRMEMLKETMRAEDIAGMVIREAPNIIYFTGLFISVTERPFFLFVPSEGEPTFFSPYLDVDLLETWWVDDYETYFDYPENEGTLDDPGNTVDLLTWMTKGIVERGMTSGKLAFDRPLSRGEVRRIGQAIPNVKLVDRPDIPLGFRMVKTPEELALIRRAVSFGDRIMEYSVYLIEQYGADLWDHDVARMIRSFGEDLIFSEVEVDGRPHVGSGCGLRFCSVRAGRTTAYPHPNQPYRKRLEPGDAVQVALVPSLGGHTAEYYRALHIDPMTDHARKLWEAHTEVTKLQAELSKPGITCGEVARRCLLRYQELGVQDYVYHRPAHGQGMEGHQPPFISPGDRTVLERGMCFSNEPGLYDPARGIGYNHGNVVIVGEDGGQVPNAYPMDLNDCLLDW